MKTVCGVRRRLIGSKSFHHPLPLQATVSTVELTWLALFMRSKIIWIGQRIRGYVLVLLNCFTGDDAMHELCSHKVSRGFTRLFCPLLGCVHSSGAHMRPCHLLLQIDLRWWLLSRDFCFWVSTCILWTKSHLINSMSLSTWNGASCTVLDINTFVLSQQGGNTTLFGLCQRRQW